jgi:hypothetical protein
MPAVGSGQAHILSLHVSLVLRAHSYRPLPTFLCQNHRAPHPKASPSAPQATYHADGHVHGHVPRACCQPTGPRAVPAIGRASFASGHALNRPPPPVRASPRPPLRLLSVALSIIASPALLPTPRSATATTRTGRHLSVSPPGLDRARAALNSACAVCARAAPKPTPSATLDRAPPRPPTFPRARCWTSSRSSSTALGHGPALARAALDHIEDIHRSSSEGALAPRDNAALALESLAFVPPLTTLPLAPAPTPACASVDTSWFLNTAYTHLSPRSARTYIYSHSRPRSRHARSRLHSIAAAPLPTTLAHVRACPRA